MKKLKLFLVILIAAMLLAATPVKAADSENNSGKIIIIHRSGEVENKSMGKENGQKNLLASKMGYILNKGEVIEICVADPNPFFYSYKLKGFQTTEIEDYTEISKFLEAIKPFFASVNAVQNQNTANNNIKKNLETSRNKVFSAMTKTDFKNRENMAVFVKSTEIENFYDTLGLDTNFFSILSLNIEYLHEYAGKIPDYILQTINSDNIPLIRAAINKWNLVGIKDVITQSYSKINAAQIAFIRNIEKWKNQANIKEDLSLISTMITFAQDQRANIMELLGKVESFKKTFDEIEKPITLGKFTYSEKKKITATVEITSINNELNAKANIKLNTGSFDFIFNPYTAFKYGFGVCQILSTFKNTDENGKEKNVQLQVPMLTITPQKWDDDWDVKPIFQLGFTVKDDFNHLLLGPGIKILNNFYVGGGAHLRWGKDSLLKLGGYLNISFTPLKLN